MNYRVTLTLILIISCFWFIDSRGSRGGGSRGSRTSGSRAGGSRLSSGSRSGSYGKIGTSARYNMWAYSHSISPSLRYRTSSYKVKRDGIMTGLIIVSPYQRRTYKFYHDSSFDDISICYNESPLYGRNISQSPWFVCPWNDMSYRYCCGFEVEEVCCRYFDRTGHLAGLIFGIFFLIILIVVICHFSIKRYERRKKVILTVKCNYTVDNNPSNTWSPTNEQQNEPCPPYPLASMPKDGNEIMVNSPPYPVSNEINSGSLQYPTNPGSGEPYPTNPGFGLSYSINPGSGASCPTNPESIAPYPNYSASMPQTNLIGYDESSLSYPLLPPEVPPPSYSDVMKNQQKHF